jgi:hypothetical protein
VSKGYQTGVATLAKQKPDTPKQLAKRLKMGAELLRRDDEYDQKQKLAKKQSGPPPKHPPSGKEAPEMKKANKLQKPKKESAASLEYDEPVLATQIAARVGLSVEQVGQALFMFRSGQTIESVATRLGVPSGQAELTQRLLAAYGNGVRINETIDAMIEEIEGGETPAEVVKDGDVTPEDIKFPNLYLFDGEPSDVYIYDADLLCADCGEKVKERLAPPDDPDSEESFDSDDYPQGPYGEGGGESDTPQHCGSCGMFLGNPLTKDGVDYVAMAIEGNDGDPKILEIWRDFYGSSHPELRPKDPEDNEENSGDDSGEAESDEDNDELEPKAESKKHSKCKHCGCGGGAA